MAKAALAALVPAFLLLVDGQAAWATGAGALHIQSAWIRSTPNAAPTAAAYVTIANTGKIADRLLGGATAAASTVEPHSMSMVGGVMRMRLLPGGYPLPAGATLTLAPGGDHLMLVGLKRPLRSGEHVSVILRFAHAAPARVTFAVRAEPPAAGDMGGMDMK